MANVNIGFLYNGSEKMQDTITKCIAFNADIPMMAFYRALASLLKIMKGRALKEGFSSIVFAIEDNGATMEGLVTIEYT